jgi:hypothetical protein
VLIEPRDAHDGSVVPGHDPPHALRWLGVVADGEDRQYLVGHQPAQREDERPHRRLVRPVQVVDDEHHRPGRLELAKQLEQAGPGEDRVGCRRGRRRVQQRLARGSRGARQLPVREQRLRLLAARLKDRDHRRLTCRGKEVLEQRRLPDPGRALHLDHLRPPAARVLQAGTEHAKLFGPADERVHRALPSLDVQAGRRPRRRGIPTLLPAHDGRAVRRRGRAIRRA